MINLVLVVGVIALIKEGIKAKFPVIVLLSGELMLEFTDLIDRLMKLNTLNTYNYALSQFFGLVILTVVYNNYYIQLSREIRGIVYCYAGLVLVCNMLYVQDGTFVTFYSNIISCIVICTYAASYFMKIIREGRAERDLFIVNIFVFLFFSVECLISTVFNFLISNHLNWVAPIWLFRGVLLLSFYIAFINMGCGVGKIRTR
ncbi:hypothetical protein C1631_006980 [Chryseobacterium phosphatilyticum]|uniref:Uncharacterized protein n=1 Tax=Chryseobacterium phosphatilyticum TaxID=475075 RepID=A0A316XHS0_9FLAO|nr:hypothetical protein [Chryseobacterium phosphatilyticum]PWN72336.1 hypothetical protein C1631_006980 [Chryseobacterium phosphatilyticum]